MRIISIRGLINYIKYNWFQILLITLAIYDLRIDIRILYEFFTLSTLFYSIAEHPLAITVLISSPYILRFKK